MRAKTEIGLKVVTFNVFHDYPLCRHVERRLALLADALRREAPDVVLLQEISVSTQYGHLPEQLIAGLRDAGLHYELSYAPANGSMADGGTFEEGSAILSRFPIVDAEAIKLAPSCPILRSEHGYEFEEFRIALRATLAPREGAHLDVFTAHVTDLAEDPTGHSPRRLQIEHLARMVTERPSAELPAIVGGDLNARPDSAELRLLREAGIDDLCDGREPGATNDADDRDLESPRDTANQRIDYLLAARGRRGRVGARELGLFLGSAFEIEPGRHLWASDHSGLMGDLWLEIQ